MANMRVDDYLRLKRGPKKPEIYISTDVEADGPIPGKYSMLSYASAAYTTEKKLLSTFSANLNYLPGAIQNPSTMQFWADQPEAWTACRTDTRDPASAMVDYVDWLEGLQKDFTPVFVAFPAGFDFTFVRWYLEYFTDKCPFGFQSLDVKSFVMPVLKRDFKECTKKNFVRSWFQKGLPHTHVALDDAIEQGATFINIYREVFGLDPIDKIDDVCGALKK